MRRVLRFALVPLLPVLGCVPLLAGAASASAATTVRPACSDSYVVDSQPLYDTATGEQLYSYGYVQLWYDGCDGENWARVVSLVGDTTDETAIVYNTDGQFSDYYCGSGTINVSPALYSPVYNAGAWGAVVADGIVYHAEADQSGASYVVDVPDGFSTCS